MANRKVQLIVRYTLLVASLSLWAQSAQASRRSGSESEIYNCLSREGLISRGKSVWIALEEGNEMAVCIFEFQGKAMSARSFQVGRNQSGEWVMPKAIRRHVDMPENYKAWLLRIINGTNPLERFDQSGIAMGAGELTVRIKSPHMRFDYRIDPIRDSQFFEIVALIRHTANWGILSEK